jgi:hypothetical protein
MPTPTKPLEKLTGDRKKTKKAAKAPSFRRE